MGRKESGERWRQSSEVVISEIKGWRAAHPKATLAEIEAAIDERLGRLRREMVEDTALDSAAVEWDSPSEAAPVCPKCGAELSKRGKARRRLTTSYDQRLELEREYGVCPVCQSGFFPPG